MTITAITLLQRLAVSLPLKHQAGSKKRSTRVALVAKIGENMNIRRASILEVPAGTVNGYVHMGGKIGVLVAISATGEKVEEVARHVAMHVAAASPQFVKPEEVPAEVVAKEKEIQIDIAIQSGKPADIAEKMVSGRMKKFTGEISLTGQPFIKEPSQTVGELLASKGADVVNFIRFEVGEGIEKKEEDFAAEVAAQLAAAKK